MNSKNICGGIFFILCLTIIVPACRTTNDITDPSDFARTIRKGTRQHLPFIMYSGIDTFIVKHIMVERSRRDVTVQLDRIDSVQQAAPTTLPAQQKTVVLYMRDSISYLLKEPHTIPINKISRILVKD